MMLTGEPGVGKTALVAEVCAHARGVRMVRATGIESEASLGFSLLADLLRPFLELIGRIPRPQAAALEGALALAPPARSDPFAVFAGTLSLLAAAAERSPLLVCVDDAQWVDVESARALAFSARRIYAEPIAIVVAARAEEPLGFPVEAFEPLMLNGLDSSAAAELLASVSGVHVAPNVATRLHAETGGNPLALVELCNLLGREQLEGRVPVEEPLPVGASIERLFWRRIARQPPQVQQALVVAANSDSGDLREIAAALRRLGLSASDLEPAEDADLIALDGERVAFTHPLLRAVALGAAPARERRAAHRALADAVTGPEAALRRAWHRASATTGPDEAVARQLDLAGAQLTARSGFAAAASAIERAAALSEAPEPRAKRLLAAAQAAYLAGLFDRAREGSRLASECSNDPLLSADCARLRGLVELYSGDVLEANRVLIEAAERIAPYDQVREAQLLIDAALPLIVASEHTRAHDLAQRACERAVTARGDTELLARKALGMTLTLLGKAISGYPLMLEGLELEARQPASMEGLLLLQWGANAAVWVEDYDRARTLIATLVGGVRTAGALTPLPYALCVQSDLEFRTGHWAAALAAATEAVSIAQETGQGGTAAYSLVSLASIEAALGRDQATREHTTQALTIATQTHADSIRTVASAARGHLELALGNPDRAREHLAPLPESTRNRLGDPGVVWWQPDWIEANIRLGERPQAHEALSRLEREASNTGRITPLAAAHRCRGLLAPDNTFESHFEHALTLHDHAPTPFERARTQLCFGERLRRAGARRRAREQLREALHTFTKLGANPWARHADNELNATGATRTTASQAARQPLLHELLTARELQIALAIAEGATNKQAAAALFLSPKTIEFHLGHIYHKLGIRSRTQLARTILESTTGDEHDPATQSTAATSAS